MDITQFVVSLREKALLEGDYGTYRAQLSNKVVRSRRKLGIATKNRGKYQRRDGVTIDQIRENHEYLRLQLLTGERAWAHAMSMKAAHSADNKGISARTRSHIVSRIDKGARIVEALAATLAEDGSTSAAQDVLEADAYASLLRGAAQFEKQSWRSSLISYSRARMIYSILKADARRDVFTDLITETVDPSIRYAAYRVGIPRTQPTHSIARQAFPASDTRLVEALNRVNPKVLDGKDDAGRPGLEDGPKTLSWRSREVRIEDAAISEAWSAVQEAKIQLRQKLSSKDLAPKDMAAAYDDLLAASQDAVDATHQAIEELRTEGVSQGDSGMQSLQITRTAVNYENIGWRIGRNRVLIGERDGLLNQSIALRRKKSAKRGEQVARRDDASATMSLSQRLTHIKEKVVLYDGTLQSIDSIRELPGVAADATLIAQLEATHQYFDALKCVALASSHSCLGQQANALALAQHASRQAEAALSGLSQTSRDVIENPPSIGVSQDQAAFLRERLRGLVQRYRALVMLGKQQASPEVGSRTVSEKSLVERLAEYPAEGVSLDNIVVYPPQMEPVPVKPLFLDVAWNYIAYPSMDGTKKEHSRAVRGSEATTAGEEKQPQKRGWFGFGR